MIKMNLLTTYRNASFYGSGITRSLNSLAKRQKKNSDIRNRAHITWACDTNKQHKQINKHNYEKVNNTTVCCSIARGL